MRASLAFAFAVAVVLLIPSIASSGSELDDGVLTFNEAWTLTRQHSPQRAAAQAQVDAARFRLQAAAGALLPSVTVQSSYARLSELDPTAFEIPGLGSLQMGEAIPNMYTNSVEVSQPLFTGFALTQARRAAACSLDAAQQDARLVEMDLEIALEQAYFGEVAAAGMLGAVMQGIATITAHRELVLKLEEVGLATHLDVTQADTRLAALEVAKVEVESARNLARLATHFLTGIPLGTVFAIQETVDSRPTPELNPGVLLQEAYAARPELLALAHMVDAADAMARIEAAALLPSVGAQFRYQYDRPNQRIYPMVDEYDGTWDVSIGLRWTVFDGFAALRRSQAARREHQALARQLDHVRDLIALDVAQRAVEVQAANGRVVASTAALRAAEEYLRVAKERYEVGDTTNTDVLDAQTAETEARVKLIQAQIDLRLASVRLMKSLGRDPE